MASAFPPDHTLPDGPERAATPAPSILRRVASRALILAVILALLAGVFAAVHATSASTPAGMTTAGSGTHPQTASAQQPGHVPTAPDFTLALLSGAPFHLAAQRGHVLVLYFMATGCAGCEPGSTALAQALASAHIAGAEALAIDVSGSDQSADLEAFVQSLGIPASASVHWGIDTTGAITNAYHIQTLETTIVIDPQGQIAYRNDGSVPAQLAQMVRSLA